MFFLRLFLVCVTCFAAFKPTMLYASTCTPTVVSGESIQTAIDSATSGDTICIGVGTYSENLTLVDGVTLMGEELGRTIIDGGGSGTVITGATSAIIKNLTIKNGDIGISATEITDLTINNVIIVGNDYGILCSGASATISNSVIDQNNTIGIYSESSSTITTLQNSIISNNAVDIGDDGTTSYGSVSNNLIYNNSTENYSTSDTTSVFEDPLFVNSSSNDYHLQGSSPAIDMGTGDTDFIDSSSADIGAYGGSGMDVTPFYVSGLSASSSDDTSLSLSWSANNAYNIAGYKVYFGSASGSYDGSATEGSSPIDVGDITSASLSGLAVSSTPPSAPDGVMTSPGNGTIAVSWNSVSDATGYKVYYGTSSGSYSQSVDVGSATSYTIEGLTNGTVYYITVSAYSGTTYYLTVTAYDDSANESSIVNETTVTLGAVESSLSTEVTDFPEESVPYPNLSDEGLCFIATAAYGSNMEPDVATLRKFRDHFLLTNYLGKKFVAVYYRMSPPLADFIRDHDMLRLFVRMSLIPFVLAAKFALAASLIQKILFSALITLAGTTLLMRRWSRRVS